MKGLISIGSLGRDDLEALVRRSIEFRSRLDGHEPDGNELAGRAVANLFFEPSTRTRLSFHLAARRLGAIVLTYDPATSSSAKGESLRDTILTVAAVGADVMVVRHSRNGVPEEIAGWSDRPVVNAGDGTNEHPTQALLDAVTIKKRFGRLDGLRMAIVGDIAHSRVANSLMKAMPTLGVDLTLVGPSNWLPADTTAPTTDAIDDVLAGVDVLYLLRVQTERGGEITERFVSEFGIDRSRAGRLRGEAVVMHPGPINRGVEISEEVADGPRSLILEQVANGVPSRMAVLEAILVPG